MATKEQERKALAKIKKIVAELGEETYIGRAFEGVFELAERNIDDDFWDSFQSTIEMHEDTIETLEHQRDQMKAEIENMKLEHEELNGHIEELNERIRKLREDKFAAQQLQENSNKASDELAGKLFEANLRVQELEQETMRLKARLFDMMEAQGA